MRDHRGWLVPVAAGLTVPFLAGLEASMVNPIGEHLALNRAADAAWLVGTGLLVAALPSRAAATLWVDTGALRRLGWLVVVTAVECLLTLALAPAAVSARYLLVVLGLVWALPALVALTVDFVAGMLGLFVLAVSLVLAPRDGPMPWWSPLYQGQPSWLWVCMGALALVLLTILYATNGLGRRRY